MACGWCGGVRRQKSQHDVCEQGKGAGAGEGDCAGDLGGIGGQVVTTADVALLRRLKEVAGERSPHAVLEQIE